MENVKDSIQTLVEDIDSAKNKNDIFDARVKFLQTLHNELFVEETDEWEHNGKFDSSYVVEYKVSPFSSEE